MTPDALATLCANTLFERDEASRGLGMRIVETAHRRAVVTMTVRADMLNGHAVCHGGFIFALADSAFAFACNSENVDTLAQHCGIDFIRPARLGDVLTATAEGRHQGRTTGVYDVHVEDPRGRLVATMRGNAFRLGSHLLEDDHG